MEQLAQQIAALQQQQAQTAAAHRQEMQQLATQLAEARRETQAAVLQIAEARRQEEQANNDRRATLELALRVANRGGNEIIDAKGVGQPGKFSGKEESEFQEWAHKVVCFMSAKFGPDFTPGLKWAASQRKKITNDGSGDTADFVDAWGEDIVDLEAKAANL